MRISARLRASPLRIPAFRVLLGGHFVSLIGDQIYFLALPWAALQFGASAGVVGALLAAAALPRAVLMLGGGVVADRFGGRRVMIISDILRTLIMATVAVAAFASAIGLAGLFVVVVIFGVFDALFQPALTSLLPRLLPAERLPSGNGLRSLALRAATIIGPPIAGALVPVSLGWVFAVDAATFLVSVLALQAVRDTSPDPSEADQLKSGFWRQLAAGLRYAAGNRSLATMLAFIALVNAGFAGPVTVGIPLLAHHQGWGATGLGLMMSALGVGATAGAALLGLNLMPGTGTGRLMLFATGLQGLCLGVVTISPTLATTAAVIVCFGLCFSLAGSTVVSLVQSLTDRSMFGRVGSLMYLAMGGLSPITFAASGVLGGWIGPRPLFTVGAAIHAVAVALAASSARVRTARVGRRSTPSTPADDAAQPAVTRSSAPG
jgi:MFS family permease